MTSAKENLKLQFTPPAVMQIRESIITYNNHQITAVNMHKEQLDGACLARYPLILGEQIKMQN